MLFIDSYNAKSLDRSSVSMIDKFNSRLDAVNDLINELMSLVDDLLALITSIRYTLGTAKSRVYSNLEQMEEVIEGNGITGTESTIQAIEDALEAGDDAMSKAEANLEDIKAAAECDQTIEEAEQENTDTGDYDCGENPEPNSEEFDEDDCTYCSYNFNYGDSEVWGTGSGAGCNICSHSDCNVDVSCDEHKAGGPDSNCSYEVVVDTDCHQTTYIDNDCEQITCEQTEITEAPENCSFSCSHSSECGQMEMPENCTYTCTDGEGCDYGDDDCSYSTVCGQEDACNEIDCSQYDCGEPCGETCHMTDDCSDSDSDDDCAESCGEDDCSYGCDDEGTGTEQGCAEGSCGEGSCGML